MTTLENMGRLLLANRLWVAGLTSCCKTTPLVLIKYGYVPFKKILES
jgi:hypothetical protein